jgi:MFS family permease
MWCTLALLRESPGALVFTSIGHFLNDGNFLMVSLLIVYYGEVPQVNITYVALMAIGINVISGLMSMGVAKLSVMLKFHGFLIFLGICLEASSLFLFAVPFVYPIYWFPAVLSGSILLGSGQSFYHPLGASILRSSYGVRVAPIAMGINGSIGSVGRSAIPVALGFLILDFGNFDGLTYLAIAIFIGAVMILFGLRDYRAPVDKPPARTGHKNGLPRQYWVFILYLTVVVFLRSMFMGGSVLYLDKYVYGILGSKILSDVFLTVTLIPPILGQPILGVLTSRMGGRFTTNMTGIISVIFFFLFLATDNVILMGVSFGIYAFMAFSLFPVMLGFISQQVKESEGAISNSIAWGLGNSLGVGAGILLMTLWVNDFGLDSAMYFILVFGVISTLLFISIRPDLVPRGKAEENSAV